MTAHAALNILALVFLSDVGCTVVLAGRRQCDELTMALRNDVTTLREDTQVLRGEVKTLESSIEALKTSLDTLNVLATRALPEDCTAARARGSRATVAMVAPPGLSAREVRCNQTVDGGGWTVVLARRPTHHDPRHRQNFNASWLQYKEGFGDPWGEYWIGNEVLRSMTRDVDHQLRVQLTTWDDRQYFATWDHFRVGSEEEGYAVSVHGYDNGSTAGDGFYHHHERRFSTHDVDNDIGTGHCARDHGGGWWYFQCYESHLTGAAGRPGDAGHNGIVWRPGPWRPRNKTLQEVTMMIRPRPTP